MIRMRVLESEILEIFHCFYAAIVDDALVEKGIGLAHDNVKRDI